MTSLFPAVQDESARSRTPVLGVVWVVCVAGIVLRFLNLDADPSFALWIGYITDEGRWNETARNLVLFRELVMYGISQIHLVLSPGYQAVNSLVFELAGVSLWSARLFSAVSGSLVLIMSVWALQRHVDGLALLVGAAVLGSSTLFVNLSRLAIPEMQALLFSLMTFLVLVLGRRSWVRALIAGLLFACAVAMKGTTVLMAPAFVLVLVATRGRETAGTTAWLLASFAAGLVVPAAIGLALAAAAGLLANLSLPQIAAQLAGYVDFATPFVVAARFLDDPFWAPVMSLMLGAWYGSWVGSGEVARRDPVVTRLYIATGIWSLWAVLVWAIEAYSPGRYLVQVMLPLTLHMIVVTTIWRRGGGEQAMRGLRTVTGWAVLPRMAWLALPTGLLLGAVAARVAGPWAFDLSRLSHRAVLLLGLVVLVTLLVVRLRSRHAAVRMLFAVPGLFGALWLINSQYQRPLGFWHGGSTLEQAAFWVGLALAVGAAMARTYGAVIVLLVVTLVASGVHGTSVLYTPSYTMRDVSRDLGQQFPDGKLVCSVQAASLFLENRLRYRDDLLEAESAAGAVILAHPDSKRRERAREFLGDGFVEAGGYDLQVGAGYWWEPGMGEVPERFVRLEVFRKRK